MKVKKFKKGFTLVELIVVIAVIAILAAVLIPTYTNLVHKANVSADSQLVRNLNERMALYEAETGKKPETAHEAFMLTEDFGFIIEKLTPTSSGNEIVWDMKSNRFALIEKNTVKVIFSDSSKEISSNPLELWKVYKPKNQNNIDLSNSKYSVYLAGNNFTGSITANVGIDVGRNAGITSITYANNKADQDVVIRTNSFETTLTINAPLDTVKHYGEGLVVDIQAIAGSSYHEFGNVGFTQVASGKFVAETGSKTNTVVATSEDAVIVINGGEIDHKYATNALFGESKSKGNVELEVIAPDKVEEKKQDAIDAITPDPYAEIVAGGLAVNASYAILKDDLTLYGYDMPLANVGIDCVFVLLKDIKIDFSYNFNSTITVDLNGHTLDLTGDGEYDSGLGLVDSNWILKDSKGNGKCIVPNIDMMGNSTMIIESGFYELETVNKYGFGVNPLIKGGTFTNNPEVISKVITPAANPNCVAPGYHAVDNGDGTWTVVAD